MTFEEKEKEVSFTPSFIKPVHYHDKSPVFSPGKANKNTKKGIETSVVIDLNVVSKMKDVMQNEISYDESGLQEVVRIFNNTSLCLSPGFSFNEASSGYYKEIYSSFETFLSKYCPTYVDAPNALALPLDKDNDRFFKTLPLGERYLHSISYLAMLLIQFIMREFGGLTPIQKFVKYVEYMILNADILTAIEAEVAKYCFYDTDECDDIAFKIFCKKIRSNFFKEGKKNYILKNALNSASDIVYYRVVAIQSNEELSGVTQDTWLLTADEGLKNIAKVIYFIPSFDGCDHKAVRLVRNEFQKKSMYWKYCDDIFGYYNLKRNFMGFEQVPQQDVDCKFEHIISCTSVLEERLAI